MHFNYPMEKTCAYEVSFDLIDGRVKNIVFSGGCNGNLKAISRILDGWTPQQIAEKCMGNTCDALSTSCADQLARAVLRAEQLYE